MCVHVYVQYKLLKLEKLLELFNFHQKHVKYIMYKFSYYSLWNSDLFPLSINQTYHNFIFHMNDFVFLNDK